MSERTWGDSMRGATFPLRNRLARALWHGVWLLLFRPSPRPCHAWRALILRVFGAKIGRDVHIYPAVRIWAPWNLDCGDGAGVADGVTLYNQGVITLGRRVVVSQGAHLCTGTHDYESPGFPLVTRPITVGDDAWLAAECFVHPGVTIGGGAVAGARAVVTGDLPAWTVCSGHPCKPLFPRKHPTA